MKSVMVDIETLSTANDACVISIGLAAFDESGVTDTAGFSMPTDDWHGHIDPSTVKWWMKQSEAARAYSFSGTTSAIVAALKFRQFVAGADEVWANSPQFDITILQNWWKRVPTASHFPVSYKIHRDLRTIFAEAKRLGVDIDDAYKMGTTAHNPVDDAANQARVVVAWRKHFKE